MTTENDPMVTDPTKAAAEGAEIPSDKGKGKAVATEENMPDAMDEDDSSDEDENADGDADEDGMDEIDTNNIITGGRRTRGRVIDFAKAAEENPPEGEEDEEEDEDFHVEGDEMGDEMDED